MRELDTIRSTAILSDADFDFLASAAGELQDTLAKRQIFRTETEMHVSVLNDVKHPTSASKYWQAVREQGVMFENLVTLSFDYRRNELKIRRLTQAIESAADEFAREEGQIDLDECLFKRASFEAVAKDRIRELKLWSGIKAALDDGSFDTADVNSHQLVSYARRFMLQAANAPADMPVAEANNLRGQLVTALKHLQSLGLLDQALAPLPPELVTRVLGDSVQQLKGLH